MAKRTGIGKKLRFEVFKRDSFACQYCGKKAPEVVLHVDHIDPVSNGGGNDILNLITSCADCNSGKGGRTLDDQSTLAKQQAQLAELNERREQLEMMVQWRQGLQSLKERETNLVAEHWEGLVDGQYFLNPTGLQSLKKLIGKFGTAAVMDAMAVATEKYLVVDQEGHIDRASVGTAFQKLGGICALASLPQDERRLYYIRAIVRNRMYCNEAVAQNLLERGLSAGVPVDEMERAAKQAKNWTKWQDWVLDLISEYEQ